MANASFDNVHLELVARHVMNNTFFMNTVDQSVVGLDPYDESLTIEQKQAILEESINNPWYFIREVLVVPRLTDIINEDTGLVEDHEVSFIPYELTLSSLITLYTYIKNINSYVVPSSEEYNLDTFIGICVYEVLFMNLTPGVVINNKYGGGQVLFDYIIYILDNLPNYLKDNITWDENTSEIYHGENLVLNVTDDIVSKNTIESIKRKNYGKISIYPNFEYMPVTAHLLNTHDNEGVDIIMSPPGTLTKDIGHLIANCFRTTIESEIFDLTDGALANVVSNKSTANMLYGSYTDYTTNRTQESVSYIVGKPGYTPIRGIDYWNAEDIAAIHAYIDNAILEAMAPPIDEPVEDPVVPPVEDPIDEPVEDPVDEPVEDPIDEPVEDPVDEPVEDPIDEPVEDPVDEPVDEPVEDPVVPPVEDPIDEPVEDPVDEPVEDPIDEPVEDPVDEPVEDPIDEPVDEPVVPPVEEPVVPPVEDPIDEPVEDPIDEPVEDPIDEPVDEPVVPPVEDPVDEPVDEPVEEPVVPPVEDPIDEPPVDETVVDPVVPPVEEPTDAG